jgi:hypothetical protein
METNSAIVLEESKELRCELVSHLERVPNKSINLQELVQIFDNRKHMSS